MQPTIYPVRRGPAIWLILASLGFAAACVWIIMDEPTVGDWIMGSIGIAFFGGGALVHIVRMFGPPPPALTISDTGFRLFRMAEVTWAEVSHVRMVTVNRLQYLDVVLHDPGAYLERHTGTRQPLAKTNGAFGLSPVAIAPLGRKTPHSEVLLKLKQHHPALVIAE